MEDRVKDLKSKQRIAGFLKDPLILETKPRKLEKIYSILGGMKDMEVLKI